MRKKNGICMLASAVMMLVFPVIAVTFVKADHGMAVMLLLFFAVNPMAAIAIGIFAGRNVSSAWFQPLLLAVFFVLGAWSFWGMGRKDFSFYAIIYLALGYISMFLSSIAVKKG